MKMQRQRGTRALSLMLAACMLLTGAVISDIKPKEAAAATKVTEVKEERTTSTDKTKQTLTLTGVAEDGTQVWTYTAPAVYLSELDVNKYFIKGNMIYIFSTKLIVLDKNTGKVKWKYGKSVQGTCAYFDKSGNIYYTGYYEDYLWCVSKKGKLVFKTKFPTKYYWPYKITEKSGKIRVYFSGDDNGDTGKTMYMIFSKKGKYQGVKKSK